MPGLPATAALLWVLVTVIFISYNRGHQRAPKGLKIKHSLKSGKCFSRIFDLFQPKQTKRSHKKAKIQGRKLVQKMLVMIFRFILLTAFNDYPQKLILFI